MTRRGFVMSAAGAAVAVRCMRPAPVVLNYKFMGLAVRTFTLGKVFVDGVEIKRAWYIDTGAGIVKTYDVFGDDQVYGSQRALSLAGQPGIELPISGIASKTLTGKVTLFYPDGRPA